MAKIYVVEDCYDCPHLSEEYFGTRHRCMKSGKLIPNPMMSDSHFPESCPLEDYK